VLVLIFTIKTDNMQQQIKIILFFLSLFLLSSVYLFAIDSRYNNPKNNSSWYAIFFNQAKSNSLDFTIENFSSQTNFHWELLSNKEKIASGDTEIETNAKETITLPEKSEEKTKYTVRVSAGNLTQEIYKN